MQDIIVKDKEGNEREVTKRMFELVGGEMGCTIVGNVKPKEEMTDIQKAIAEKRAEKAEREKGTIPTDDTIEAKPITEEVKVKSKPGPKPKTKE